MSSRGSRRSTGVRRGSSTSAKSRTPASVAHVRAVTVGGVEITKPDKRLFPDGTTKADLAGNYEAVASVMLHNLPDRPLNLQRHPYGVEGHAIFQQRIPDYFPDWI